MSEHLSTQTIEGYGRRELTVPELLVADDHLATCDECHQRVSRPERLQVAMNSLMEDLQVEASGKGDHLSYEQLAGMVDNELDDVSREIVSVHLEVCSQCATELDGLQALKRPATFFAPRAQRRSPTRLEQLLGEWRQPGTWAWSRLVGAAVVVLLVSVMLWIVWRSSRQQRTEIVESTRPAVGSESPVPSTTGSPSVDQASGQPQPGALSNSSPRIVVALNDGGHRVVLDEEGNLIGLPTLPQSYHESVKRMLTTERLNLSPALKELGGKNGVLMGAPIEGMSFALVSPVGTIVRSTRPTFRWRPLPGATSYVVRVFDTRFTNIQTSPAQTATEWKVSSPLARDSLYIWQVTAIKNGDEIKSPVAPAPEARFRVLGRAKAAEVEQAEKTYANSHLVLGSIYAQAGLLEDAAREFRLLQKANPGYSLSREVAAGGYNKEQELRGPRPLKPVSY